MRVLLDQGLPRSAAGLLRAAGIDAVHAGECGLAEAIDTEILHFARRQNRVIFTLDADFHAFLVLGHASAPSVVRFRIEGLRADSAADAIRSILQSCREELAKGAMVSVTEDRVRIHYLPV